MLVQHWTLQVSASAWLIKLRLLGVAFFVACAGLVFARAVGWLGVSGWWGDWLWPWPIILYASWVLAWQRAPLLSAGSEYQLLESGYLEGEFITHSLCTPWWVALALTPAQPPAVRPAQHPRRWAWVIRDQLNDEGWTRLNRVCRAATLRSIQPPQN